MGNVNNEITKFKCIVIGGGIAGVTCAEHLSIDCEGQSILLLTESHIIKTVSNVQPIARYLTKFDVSECNTTDGFKDGIVTLVDKLVYINSAEHQIRTLGGRIFNYEYLCLCTGGKPKLFTDAASDGRVIGIRDTDSVLELQRRLRHASSVLILGNGGIASELAYELRDVLVHWVIKDEHITSTFVDAGAAHFFQQAKYKSNVVDNDAAATAIKRWRYSELQLDASKAIGMQQTKISAALGPDWQRNFNLHGQGATSTENLPIIYYKSNIRDYHVVDNKLIVSIAKEGAIASDATKEITCDFIISATGVTPRVDYATDKPFKYALDGGIAVDDMMCTNLPDVFAAGDVCTAAWDLAPHWFQMRLWTQARQMGAMAARSIVANLQKQQTYQDFCFELFGHVTELFGFPVVLLGRFNGQGLGNNYELLLRSTPAKEYIKFVLENGKLRGALLIGDTELAETCENLILNGIDLTPYGDSILDPDIDIGDYFD